METVKEGYTVSRLAKMAGVSVRTLHHYDAIGLLVPATRSAAGYRLYGEVDLLRLQQILFFRELGFALGDICQILDGPDFDPLAALEDHRRQLLKRAARINRLLNTIDRTIAKLMEHNMNDQVTDEELFAGFTEEQVARYEREVRERYDPELFAESSRRVREMTKGQWQALQEEGEAINQGLAALMGRVVEDREVQALVDRHFAMMNQFYPVSAAIYSGLGQIYVTNDEFRAYYEHYAPGLADFLQEAIVYYVENSLAEA